MPSLEEQKAFLEKDLYDALVWLFVGAVAWQATEPLEKQTEGCYHQRAQGMFTSLVQARSLYEFYYQKKGPSPDDARATDFAPTWTAPESTLYRDYMCRGKPANKRVFHLVYGRSKAALEGGPAINTQVLAFARDLRRITEAFVKSAGPQFIAIAQSALDRALKEAKKTAESYRIASPV